jgi:hypothetical protein
MSTNRIQFLKKHNLPETTQLSLEDISNLSGIPIDALRIVEARGYGAWRTNPRSIRLQGSFSKDEKAERSSRISAQAWSYGRVYAFANKTKKVFYGSDRDVAERFGLLPKEDKD